MQRTPVASSLSLLTLLGTVLGGCGGHHEPAAPSAAAAAAEDSHAGHNHGSGIALPEAVQQNLGITWARAEYRVVQGVMRLPGRFVAEPSARQSVQVPFAGRVTVLVKPYQQVAVGTPLLRLAAPEWQQIRLHLAEARSAADSAGQRLASAEAQRAAIQQAVATWKERATTLERLDREIGGKAVERTEATTRLAELGLADLEAANRVVEARRDSGPDGLAALRWRQLLTQAAAVCGLSEEILLEIQADGRPRWATIDEPELRARHAGVVEGEVVADGSWLEARTVALTVTDPTAVHLRAAGLQADLPRLRNGMPGRIVAADPALMTAIPANVVLGPMADAIDRSLDVIAHPLDRAAVPAWVRPGVTANLEVVLSGNAEEELAIPLAATIRDGLRTVLFRRDPVHPELVHQLDADLGANDGRWVVIASGLKEGDQVVLGGIYPLKLSQQQGGTQAGHFDPDGTFHTGKH